MEQGNDIGRMGEGTMTGNGEKKFCLGAKKLVEERGGNRKNENLLQGHSNGISEEE